MKLAVIAILAGLVTLVGCAGQALNEARQVNTVTAYDNFIKEYPKHSLAKEARQLREKAVFNEAKKADTVQHYEKYLKEYPSGEFKREAQSRIEEIEDIVWDESKKENTVSSYGKYLKQYPNGKYESEAKRNHETLMWEAAKKENTVSSYGKYLKQYPNGKYESEAKRNHETLMWEAAKKENTISGFNNYMKEYPSGNFSSEAKQKKELLVCETAKNDYEIAFSNAPNEKREEAIGRINNQFLLSYIAEDNVNPRIAHAALGRITLPSLLKNIAGRAAYASVRKLAEARRIEQWRKDLETTGGHCEQYFGGWISCNVSIQNKNPELSYTNIKYQPLNSTFHSILPPEVWLMINDTVKPASSKRLPVSTADVYNLGADNFNGRILLLQAEPLLLAPNEREPVLAGWKASKPTRQQLIGATPEISEEAVIGSTVQSNVFAEIVSVTTHIIIIASDPNFDKLTYNWSASNGTIRRNGSSLVYWDRPVDKRDNGRVQPGSITVVVSNSRGEKAEKTFRMD